MATVLFVDDDQNLIESLKRATYGKPFRSIFALSGAHALKILEKFSVDIVVSDMNMPGMDGLSFLITLKVKYPETIRIVLTGYFQLAQVLATINSGDVYRFLTKPFSAKDDLMPALQEALDLVELKKRKYQMVKELSSQNNALEEEIYQRTQELTKARIAAENELVRRVTFVTETSEEVKKALVTILIQLKSLNMDALPAEDRRKLMMIARAVDHLHKYIKQQLPEQ